MGPHFRLVQWLGLPGKTCQPWLLSVVCGVTGRQAAHQFLLLALDTFWGQDLRRWRESSGLFSWLSELLEFTCKRNAFPFVFSGCLWKKRTFHGYKVKARIPSHLPCYHGALSSSSSRQSFGKKCWGSPPLKIAYPQQGVHFFSHSTSEALFSPNLTQKLSPRFHKFPDLITMWLRMSNALWREQKNFELYLYLLL